MEMILYSHEKKWFSLAYPHFESVSFEIWKWPIQSNFHFMFAVACTLVWEWANFACTKINFFAKVEFHSKLGHCYWQG